MVKICMSCNRKIFVKEHYFEVIEYKDNKEIGRKFVHKNCQDTYDKMLMDRQITPEMSKTLLSGLRKANDLLTKMGGEEIIQI